MLFGQQVLAKHEILLYLLHETDFYPLTRFLSFSFWSFFFLWKNTTIQRRQVFKNISGTLAYRTTKADKLEIVLLSPEKAKLLTIICISPVPGTQATLLKCYRYSADRYLMKVLAISSGTMSIVENSKVTVFCLEVSIWHSTLLTGQSLTILKKTVLVLVLSRIFFGTGPRGSVADPDPVWSKPFWSDPDLIKIVWIRIRPKNVIKQKINLTS